MYENYLRLRIFQPNTSLLNRVLACSRALRAYVLACLRAWRTYILAVLTCTCVWRVYMFTMLACFMSLRAHMPYMFAVLKISYVLTCFFDIVCPIFFTFEKLTSKNPYIKKFLFIQRSI